MHCHIFLLEDIKKPTQNSWLGNALLLSRQNLNTYGRIASQFGA